MMVTGVLLAVVQVRKLVMTNVKTGLWNQTDPELYPTWSVTHKLFHL